MACIILSDGPNAPKVTMITTETTLLLDQNVKNQTLTVPLVIGSDTSDPKQHSTSVDNT